MLRDLPERVTIQQGSAASTQARTKTFSALATSISADVRMRISGSAGSESFKAGAVAASHPYEVEIEYRGDVTPKMRVSWTPYGGSAKTLEIQGVGQVWRGRRRRLILACAEAA